MNIKDLTKNIIDTIIINDIHVDSNEAIEFACEIIPALTEKNIPDINALIIKGLLSNYRDSEDKTELQEIEKTIVNILEYIKGV